MCQDQAAQKFTRIVVVKIFTINLPPQPFLGRHLGFHIFFHHSLFERRTVFLQLGCFGLDYIFHICRYGEGRYHHYKYLAHLLSEQWSPPYSVILGRLHCSLGFSLPHSSIMCIRESHSRPKCPCVPPAVDFAVAEGHLPPLEQ